MGERLQEPYPEEESAQIEWLRKATPAQRLAVAFAKTQAFIENSREEIRRANPNASEEELNLIFVEVHYGKELADRFKAHLAKRKM